MTADPIQSRNARWNYTEVIVASVVLFVVYKFLLISLGIAAVGIWSIVAATTSLGKLADLGTAGGLGRYIAITQADATKDAQSRAEATLVYVETALIFSTGLFIMIGAILYWPAFYALKLAVPASDIGPVALLLPFSVLSFVTMNIANVASAALIGMHRSDLKSKMAISASLVQITVAFSLKNELGIASLALAQVAQNLVVLIGAWMSIQYLVRRKLTLALPRRLRAAPLKDLAGFGIKLQFTAILALASEPTIKYVLSIIGGLATVGTYELATKGIVLVRQFIIAPTPNLVPTFASLYVTNRPGLERAYSEATARLAIFGGAAMVLLALGAPVLSVIWLGSVKANFVVYSVIMAAGWAVNIICIPGFMLGLATGRLRWNLLANVIALVMGPALGIALGATLGDPVYVVAASAVSLGVGALIAALLNCRSAGLDWLPHPGEYRSAARVLSFLRGG